MYTWDPEEYERCSSAQQEWALSALSELKIGGDERILDIGCGDGKITARISQLVPDGSVLGIDISPDMISFARRRYSPESFRNLRFKQGDALDLRFNEECVWRSAQSACWKHTLSQTHTGPTISQADIG